LAGYEEEAEATLERAQKRPKGYVKYEQKIGSNISHQPVKNVRVQSRWWFRYGNGYTNDNGYFECDKTYKHTRNVVVRVHFENQYVKIRGIKGPNFLAMFNVEDNTLGTFSNDALENINYIFYDGGLHSNAKRKWVACHGINSLQEHRHYCTQNGIFVPPSTLGGLNMWITGEKREGGITFSRYAAAPMLKQMGNTSLVGNVVKMFLVATGNPLFATALQVAIQFSPDITYNYSENNIYYTNSDQINQIFYHELAHASHYAKVGNNYWLSYIAYVVDNDGYGDPTNPGAGRIAISEAWAEYCGATFAHLRFGNSYSIGETWQSYIENFKPYAGSAYWDWIPKGLMHDLVDPMIEPNSTGVIDKVEGYTMQKCYNALTPSVTSVSQYRTTFLNQNPGMNITQLGFYNQLFSSYGY
jgi:hypothetical protein